MTDQPRKQLKVEKLELNAETIADLTDDQAEEVKGGHGAVTAQCSVNCEGQTGANCYTLTPRACPNTAYCATGPNVC